MNILIFAPNYLPATRYGGPIQSSHGLAKALVGLGHRVDVFTTNVDGPHLIDAPTGQAVPIDGVGVHYFPIQTPRRLYYSPAMGEAIDQRIGNYDAVHVNGMFLWPGPRLGAAAARAGKPVVISPRGMLVPELIAGRSRFVKSAWIRLFERRALQRSTAIHVTSDEEAAGIRSLGLDLAPIIMIGNGVDLPVTALDPAAGERLWRHWPRGRRVAFLARLDWTKGIDLAIDAVACLPDAHLLLAGHDQIGLRGALEQRILSAGAIDRIAFAGPLDGQDKWNFLAAADVVLVPSLKESFGMTVAEALAVGTPVVCTDGVGAAAIVRRTDCGGVVARSADAIAAALQGLLQDDVRRRAAGTAGQRIMAEEFTWSAIAQQMVQVYATGDQRARTGVPMEGGRA